MEFTRSCLCVFFYVWIPILLIVTNTNCLVLLCAFSFLLVYRLVCCVASQAAHMIVLVPDLRKTT